MDIKALLVPNPPAPCQAIHIDPELCTGCNSCVEVCRMDVLAPNPQKGQPPLVLYPDECWFCGCCITHCPEEANRMEHPLNQRMGWKRKATGEFTRVGIHDPHIFDSPPEATTSQPAPAAPWPYPIRYGQETVVEADVLVIGGGLAGCQAAISAAKSGQKVVVVDKGAVIRSGSGGAGIDHWLKACTNPCSRVTPEEVTEAQARGDVPGEEGEYILAHSYYIEAKESWENAPGRRADGTGIQGRRR